MPDVEIGWRRQLTTENRPWAIDLTAEMDVGDVIGSVTASLTDLFTGAAYQAGLFGAPTFLGNVVTQATAALVAGHNYRLVLSANMGGSKVTSTVLLIQVPY